MHPPISESDLAIVLSEAERAATRLRRRVALPRADLDDLRQELLLDLIRRLPQYDPARGTLGAFAGVVLRNRSSRLAARIARERRAWGGPLLSLAAPGRDGQTLGNTIGDLCGPSAWPGRESSSETTVERRIDVARALGALSRQDRRLCAVLATCPVRSLVTQGVGSRSRLYRRIAELRCALAAQGLGPAWDGFLDRVSRTESRRSSR